MLGRHGEHRLRLERPAGRQGRHQERRLARPGRASRRRSARAAARARAPPPAGHRRARAVMTRSCLDRTGRRPLIVAPVEQVLERSRRGAASRGCCQRISASSCRSLEIAAASSSASAASGCSAAARARARSSPAAPLQRCRQVVPDPTALERGERRRGIRRAQPELGELGAGLGLGGPLRALLDQLVEQLRRRLDQVEPGELRGQPPAQRSPAAPSATSSGEIAIERIGLHRADRLRPAAALRRSLARISSVDPLGARQRPETGSADPARYGSRRTVAALPMEPASPSSIRASARMAAPERRGRARAWRAASAGARRPASSSSCTRA